VIHAPDDIVAVCDETGERITLTAADLVVYELDRLALDRAIATALGIVGVPTRVERLLGADCLGCYSPAPGHRFPTYVSICQRPSDFQQVASFLAATRAEPFLLLAPTRRHFSPVTEAVVGPKNACLLPLDETLGLDERGQLVATPAAAVLLARFAKGAMPSEVVTQAETQVNEFRKQGDFWQIRFDGTTVCVRDVKGLEYVAHLIAQPGRQVHVAQAFAAASGNQQNVALGSSGEDLDSTALAAYKQRIEELGEELAQAQRYNDYGRQETVQTELDRLTDELTGALGLGGRSRERSDVDRFRKSVTMAVGRAIKTISAAHPMLGRHLVAAIQTGRFLSYAPDSPVDWVV
jgi:hypothetical protein